MKKNSRGFMENSKLNKEMCDCVFCKQNTPFDIPDELFEEFVNGDVAIFAGSGISTENDKVLKNSFYENIEWELGYEDSGKNFPEIMEEYCQQANGRIKLLTEIKKRFSHIKSFPEMHRVATRFHRELATFFPIDIIVTTNWDTYFEEECGATPFVTSEDLAFWDAPGRKVLKIHGSINNLGSIVATTSDYKKCLNNLSRGMLGSIFKLILATKTIVYIGYSFRDEDFLSINSFVKKEMKEFKKQAYIITPIEEDDDYFRKNGLIPIYTDGTYFIEQIKKHAVNGKHLIDDSIYGVAEHMLNIVNLNHRLLHAHYNCYDNPEIIICSSYQDGLIHGFERVVALKNKGEYSHIRRIINMIESYKDWRREKLKERKYEDVAYIDGYTHSMKFLLLNNAQIEDNSISLYYAIGYKYKLENFEDYKNIVRDIPRLHKLAYKRVKKMVKDLTKDSTNVEFHHPPQL